MLDGEGSEHEAIKLAIEVKTIHKNAGLNIRNWLSYSTKILEALGVEPRKNQAKFFRADK